jgi:glutaredoxin
MALMQPTGGSGPARPARVLLFSRPGCHLCDAARVVVQKVTAELGERYEERDITADPEVLRAYLESIPVVTVDGIQVDFWRISEDRLRAALAR